MSLEQAIGGLEDAIIKLTNLLEVNNMALTEGHDAFLDYQLWLDGTQSTDAVPGIDALISTTPTTGWSVVNGVMAVEELQTIYLTAERLPLAGEGKGAGRGSAATSARKSHPGGSRLSRSRPRP